MLFTVAVTQHSERDVSRIPNLFQGSQKITDAQRLYEIFLSRLITAQRSDLVLTACREIRRIATKAGRPRAGVFTYFWEMEALGLRRDFEAMWRALKAQEKARRGMSLSVASHRWASKDTHLLVFSYAPILYLRGKHRLGCRLMETALEIASRQKGWSFEWLWHVYKPQKTPSSTYDVTLAHFYTALDRDLSEWKLWNKFLDGFNPKLYRASGIAKESLRQDPRLIKPFFEWIVAERRKRLFTGTTDGQRDLVDTPSRVRRRQSARARMLVKFDEQPERDLFDQKLQQLFPELANLPRPSSFRQLLRARSRK
jgi:hypothetical protein